MRIAVGGFQHETNTFAPSKAAYSDFEAADAWPGLVTGGELIDAVQGINLPITGFIEAAQSSRHEILPLLWCSATPCGHVTRDAFERISMQLLDGLRASRSHHAIDAVFLDLHGAMVAEHIDDADGELLKRVRKVVGTKIPIVASLDFHANASALMVEQATALCSYRTYPHVDMAETGARSLRMLHDLRGTNPHRALVQLPFLIPLTSQCTLIDPLATLMSATASKEISGIIAANFTPGFPAADVADCGPAVFAYGRDADVTRSAVESLAAQVAECEANFSLQIYSIESTLRELDASALVQGRPIVLADTQDNPGGGGNADTTSLLKALAAHRVPNVLAGILCDTDAASRAHAAGVGATIDLELGAQTRFADETPLRASFKVLALGDGRFTGTGPFYKGARMSLGPMALLRTGELCIAVASKKQQAADQAMFRHLGVEPSDFTVLALKSSVHFRADFGAIASRILVVDAPGANIADPAKLEFRKLRTGVRVTPRAAAHSIGS